MLTKASAKYLRISPRKVRTVINMVRGLPVIKAEAILDTINRRPCIYIKRLLKSAVDSANKRFKVSSSDLYIISIKADCGPSFKRYRAGSMGRASSIKHRTTHITLELGRIIESKSQRDERRGTKDEKLGGK